ncbi:antitoxin Xre/MbcA/ParS toxin-binding domain-containing protein [Pseudoalteromonas sp. Q18-MNA-CIBAN-0097]|uniref:antitoxin Xre/MbcA/ParS toxin-binding domain-containing protein n=1 Tax=Pseudoalteromonas sp. Q18-MNA-CIBAN-0097 TaxID=3140440 RepID=UPI003319A79B
MRTTNQNRGQNPDFIAVVTCGKLTIRSNPLAEIEIAQTGLTTAGLRAFANLMGWNVSDIAKATGTTERTLIRNKEKPLNKQISEHALEIARLSGGGVAYFGDVKCWSQWLDTPHMQFDNHPPRAMINTIRGRELIHRIITGLQYGFTA